MDPCAPPQVRASTAFGATSCPQGESHGPEWAPSHNTPHLQQFSGPARFRIWLPREGGEWVVLLGMSLQIQTPIIGI